MGKDCTKADARPTWTHEQGSTHSAEACCCLQASNPAVLQLCGQTAGLASPSLEQSQCTMSPTHTHTSRTHCSHTHSSSRLIVITCSSGTHSAWARCLCTPSQSGMHSAAHHAPVPAARTPQCGLVHLGHQPGAWLSLHNPGSSEVAKPSAPSAA